MSYETNVMNSISLIKIAKTELKIKVIFISSMSSFKGCRSSYGKQKQEVEDAVIQMGGIVLRPGLIWGDGCNGGMFFTLNKLVMTLPFIPMIGSGKEELFLSHVEDLSTLVCRIIARLDKVTPFVLTGASSEPVTFKKILQICADANNKRRIFFPIPHIIILWLLKVFEILRLKLPVRSDSVIGLVYSDQNPIFEEYRYDDLDFPGFRKFDNKYLNNLRQRKFND